MKMKNQIEILIEAGTLILCDEREEEGYKIYEINEDFEISIEGDIITGLGVYEAPNSIEAITLVFENDEDEEEIEVEDENVLLNIKLK